MSVKEFKVIRVERRHINGFIQRNHYSGSINGCTTDYCFGLYRDDKMIGAAFFGRMAMAGQWKRFSDTPEDVIELRRLCCVDDTPKNTESYFIGKMLRWLKKNTDIRIVISYADEEYGHQGIIYKASNFKYLGKSKGAKVIIHGGKRYHDKSIRSKYKGELKPYAVRIKEALRIGEAYYKDTAGKHTYTYELKRARKDNPPTDKD